LHPCSEGQAFVRAWFRIGRGDIAGDAVAEADKCLARKPGQT